MAKFSDVFSTTAKVVIALLLLSLLVMVGLLFLGGGIGAFARIFGTKNVVTANSDPCKELRELDPHCGWAPHWTASNHSSPMDNVKTDFLTIDSTTADGFSAGSLSYANIRVCFEGGKLCGHGAVGVGVNVDGMVRPSSSTMYSTPVRVKFDDEKPISESWGITDDHRGLFPYGKEQRFLTQLLQHKQLILEFSYYEHAPRTVTFQLAGLEDSLNSIGINVAAWKAEQDAAAKAKRAALIASVKPCKFLTDTSDYSHMPYCWDANDGYGERGPYPTLEIAMQAALKH